MLLTHWLKSLRTRRPKNQTICKRKRRQRVMQTECLEARALLSADYLLQAQLAVTQVGGGNAYDHFGDSIAVDGKTMVVGSAYDNTNGVYAGIADVYDLNDSGTPLDPTDDVWQHSATLTATDAASNDLFGDAVTISGDTIVVGSAGFNNSTAGTGSVYVFQRSNGVWQQQAKLTASDGADGDLFGWSVAVENNTLIVGSRQDDDRGRESGSAYVFHRDGTTWNQQAKVTPTDATSLDNFGSSVAISGNRFVVGSPNDDEAAQYAGAVYTYVRNDEGTLGDPNDDSWRQEAKLVASDAAAFDGFGRSVSVQDQTIAVSANGDDDGGRDSGSVYVFAESGGVWNEQAKLTASDRRSFDRFGASLALRDDRIVVGAVGDDDRGSTSGSAYVFERNAATWSQTSKLTASDGAAGDVFGRAVAVVEDRIFASSPLKEVDTDGDGLVDAHDAGSIYGFYFTGSDWNETQKLRAAIAPPAPEPFAQLGYSVDIDGELMVVGARLDDVGSAYRAGAAYVFRRSDGGTPLNSRDDTWQLEAELTAADGAAEDYFGTAVSISGDIVVVGSAGDDDRGSQSGSAYIFQLNSGQWSQQSKITASDGVANDSFGSSLTVAGSTVVVGAFANDDAGTNSGSAYVFELGTNGWMETTKLIPADGAAFDQFGQAISSTTSTIVVGSGRNDTAGYNAGTVYVYERNNNATPLDQTDDTWELDAQLFASDAAVNAAFGWAVSISGDTLVSLSPGGSLSNPGAAYVYERLNGVWSERRRLTAATDTGQPLPIGLSLSYSDDVLVVGNYTTDGAGRESGSAFVFKRTAEDWAQQAELTASSPAERDYFGYAVAVSGDTIAVGSYLDDVDSDGDGIDDTNDGGAVYVFVPQSRNTPPVADAGGPYVANEGGLVAFDASLTSDSDQPNSELTFEWDLNYDGTSFQVDAVGEAFTVRFPDSFPQRSVAVRVTDEAGETDVATTTLTVNNVAPDVAADNAAVAVNEADTATNSGTFSDVGDDIVTLSASVGMITDNGDGSWNWAWDTSDGPDDSQTVTITATDSDGAATDVTFDLTVNNVAPEVAADNAAVVVNEADTATNSGTFSDVGDDIVTLSASIGTITDNGDGSWSWAWDTLDGPDESQTVTITATDSDGAASDVTFDLTVNNVAPTAVDARFEVVENSDNGTIVGTVLAGDPGDDTLTYSLFSGNESGAFVIDPATGTISVADTTKLDYETHPRFELEVTVSDDEGAADTAAVAIDLLNQASLSGTVYVDTDLDGEFDANEMGIDGVALELLDTNGNLIDTVFTSDDGFYLFDDLDPGDYQIREVQPSGVSDGAESVGSLGGQLVANDLMSVSLERTDGTDYDFAELGQQLKSGDAGSIGFWQNKHGQALIASGGTALADWLSSKFGNIFGDELVGRNGGDVASFYRDELFRQKSNSKVAGPAKVDAQFMAVALSVYFTDQQLAGTTAEAYGFRVTDTGIGTSIANVGHAGAAFGVEDDTDLTIMQLLLATNGLTNQSNQISGFAHIYDTDGNGQVDVHEKQLRIWANDLFSQITG